MIGEYINTETGDTLVLGRGHSMNGGVSDRQPRCSAWVTPVPTRGGFLRVICDI